MSITYLFDDINFNMQNNILIEQEKLLMFYLILLITLICIINIDISFKGIEIETNSFNLFLFTVSYISSISSFVIGSLRLIYRNNILLMKVTQFLITILFNCNFIITYIICIKQMYYTLQQKKTITSDTLTAHLLVLFTLAFTQTFILFKFLKHEIKRKTVL